MTVITVAPSDPGQEVVKWETLPYPDSDSSWVPRGLRYYRGTVAIAALGTNDETRVIIGLTFPTSHMYLLKNVGFGFQSDDLTEEFEANGVAIVLRGDLAGGLGVGETYFACPSLLTIRAASRALRVYSPDPAIPRIFIDGPRGDNFNLEAWDISNDASTAGDFSWFATFYEFDVEQCRHWEANTPRPTYTV